MMKAETFAAPLIPNPKEPPAAPPKKRLLSAARESLNLARHGTQPSNFSARVIADAAKSDTVSKRWNASLADQKRAHKQDPILHHKPVNQKRAYAFVPAHVQKAKSAADLIRLAITDNRAVSKAHTAQTVMVYRDIEKLKEALALLEREAE